MTHSVAITATAQLKVGSTKLKGIVVTSGTTVTAAVYDSSIASASDRVILDTMTFGVVPFVMSLPGDEQGVFLRSGLYIVLTGTNPRVTVIFD